MSKKVKTQNKPAVIGFSFLQRPVLELLLRNSYDVRQYQANDTENWQAWLNTKHDRPIIAIIEDRSVFPDALKCGCQCVIVREQFDWLRKKRVDVLDAQENEDGLIVVKDKVSVHNIKSAIKNAKPYETSKLEQLAIRSDPKSKCAGCTRLVDSNCKQGAPHKTACDSYELATTDAHLAYSLNQLVAKCVLSANLDLLLIPYKTVWKKTYQFAIGKTTKKQWVSACGRPLLTARVSKTDLKLVVAWVREYSKFLKKGEIGNPPSKVDVQLAEKLLKKT